MKSNAAKATDDVSQSVEKDPRREYTVKLPIINAGVEKVAGDKVILTDHEAESLRESGHIV